MTDTKRTRGGQWLFAGVEPRKYSFKDHPLIKDRLDVIQADLESEGIQASHSAILRVLIHDQLDRAVEVVRKHVEERTATYGHDSTQEHDSAS